MLYFFKSIFLACIILCSIRAQEFGKNIAQYHKFDWHYIQTENFDIYYYDKAKTQAESIDLIRSIKLIKVYSRSDENRKIFAQWVTKKLKIECIPVNSSAECIEDTDIITTITTSRKPVIEGRFIQLGTHLNAAGGNHYTRRELDDDAVLNSNVIVTDDINQARVECGDLINVIDRGLLHWHNIHQMSEITSGIKMGRTNENQITLYESQGLAIQDLTAAAHIYSKAIQNKIGKTLDINQ